MKIGYLVSRYPAVSHTFVRREIESLRERGLDIDTFSIRKPRTSELVTLGDRNEALRTYYVLPASAIPFFWRCLAAAVCNPRKWFSTLALALRLRVPGFWGLIWSLFHFGEGIMLAGVLVRRRIVHLHNHFSNSGASVGLLAAHFSGVGWSMTLHGSADFRSRTTPTLPRKADLADLIVCVSEHGRQLALQHVGSEICRKTLVVRCGVDVNAFKFRPAPPLRSDVHILSVGRLVTEKAQEGLIEALSMLIADCSKVVQLTILGEGPERARLEQLIVKRELRDRVMLPGSAAETEVVEALRQADLFVLSSRAEGLPVVLMEAMAVGVPVVAPRIAGIPELVTDDVNGRLFDAEDWAQLAAAMKELIDDGSKRERFSREGRRRIEQEYSVDHTVEPLFQWFSRTYGAPRARKIWHKSKVEDI